MKTRLWIQYGQIFGIFDYLLLSTMIV